MNPDAESTNDDSTLSEFDLGEEDGQIRLRGSPRHQRSVGRGLSPATFDTARLRLDSSLATAPWLRRRDGEVDLGANDGRGWR